MRKLLIMITVVVGFVFMTNVARIGRTEIHRKIRARDAHTVIMTWIDHHVGFRWHVALGATRPF